MFRKTVPMALSFCAVLLAGCASNDVVEVTEGFYGSVAADEPRAAVVARDVLVSGGSAADAAASAYFTLAVTLPSSAGLGAGGSCVVFDPEGKHFEQIDFMPRPATASTGGISIPLGPRAIFALHARYGRQPMAVLIGNAENLARFGEPVSRKLAQDLALDGAALDRSDAGVDDTLAPKGKLLKAGDMLLQTDLAATLGRLRAAGVGDLYSGQLAKRFIAAVAERGEQIDPATLRAAVPVWSAATGAEHGNHLWAVAADSAADQAFIAKTLSIALNEGTWSKLPENTDPLMMAEMTARAANAVANGDTGASEDDAEKAFGNFDASGRKTSVTPGAASLFGGEGHSGATSFAITDRSGMSVGCAMSLNAPFGTGKMLPQLGFFGVPAQPSKAAPMAAAVVAGNTNAWQVHMTAQAAGGRPVVSALASTIARTYVGGQDMEDAVAVPRTHLDPATGTIMAEAGISQDAAKAAAAAGYAVQSSHGPLATVRLFRCVGGLPKGSGDCGTADDPRGRGLILFERLK